MLGCLVLLLTACELEAPAPRALSTPPADLLARPLVRVARADGGPALVLAAPAPAALDRFARALADDPQLGLDPLAYQAFVTPELHWQDGDWRPADARSQVLRGEDPVLGDSFLVDLITVDAPGGPRHVLHPLAAIATPTPSPVDPALLVIERELALFLVDVAAGQVQHLGDPATRRAALAAAAEVPLVDEGPAVVWATAPQWSPDGAQIAFLSTRGGEPTTPELWVHNLDHGDERRVAAPGVQVRLLGWHGDDTLLVEDHDDPARPRLAAIDLDDGALRPLADGAVIGRSPDGDTLALAEGPPGRLRVDLLDLSSGTSTTSVALRPGELLRSWQADFSDDGAQLVLDTTDADGRQSLLVVDHEGAATRVPLPGRGQLAAAPTWLGERLLVPLEDLATGTTTTHLVTVP
ncbi:MAG TPA: hypothetical protein VGB85_06055 [Nannocystis sp.]|jgi:hypothetical protein